MKKLRVTVNGTAYDVEVEILEDDDYGNFSYGVPVAQGAQSNSHSSVPSSVKPVEKRASTTKKEVTSPIAGTVLEIKAKVGDTVKENDILIVIEAMKMNTNISSPASGRVKSVEVSAGANVKQGQVLVTLE